MQSSSAQGMEWDNHTHTWCYYIQGNLRQVEFTNKDVSRMNIKQGVFLTRCIRGVVCKRLKYFHSPIIKMEISRETYFQPEIPTLCIAMLAWAFVYKVLLYGTKSMCCFREDRLMLIDFYFLKRNRAQNKCTQWGLWHCTIYRYKQNSSNMALLCL